MITGFTLFVVDLVKTSELTALENELSDLRAQNALLMKQIGKIRDLDKLRADVERKLELVDKLQKGRFHTLSTLNELSQVIPENVWLTDIEEKGSMLSVKGLGESNKAIANFMRALDESPLLTSVNLKTITRTEIGNVPVRSFSLNMMRVDEKEKKPEVTKKGGGA